MSVYFEAVESGRIQLEDLRPAIALDGRRLNTGMARALRAVKRAEAEARNAKTPRKRRKAWKREADKAVADALGGLKKKRSDKKNGAAE